MHWVEKMQDSEEAIYFVKTFNFVSYYLLYIFGFWCLQDKIHFNMYFTPFSTFETKN